MSGSWKTRNGVGTMTDWRKLNTMGAGLDSEPEKHIGAQSEIRAGLGNSAASRLVSGFSSLNKGHMTCDIGEAR